MGLDVLLSVSVLRLPSPRRVVLGGGVWREVCGVDQAPI